MTTDRLAALLHDAAHGLLDSEQCDYVAGNLAAAGVTVAQPDEDGPCVRCGYLRDSGTHDTWETCDETRGPCLDPQRHHPYQSARSAPAALDAFVPLLTSCCHDMGLSEADIRVLSARLANSPATPAQPAPDLRAAAQAVMEEVHFWPDDEPYFVYTAPSKRVWRALRAALDSQA